MLETNFWVQKLARFKEFWFIDWLLSWYMKSMFTPCPEGVNSPASLWSPLGLWCQPLLITAHFHPSLPHCYSRLHKFINFVFSSFQIITARDLSNSLPFWCACLFLTHKDSTLRLIKYNIFHVFIVFNLYPPNSLFLWLNSF